VQKRDLQSGAVLALGVSASNSAYIGYPIALQASARGQRRAGGVCAGRKPGDDRWRSPWPKRRRRRRRWYRVLGDILLRLAKNPFILAIAAGVAWAAIGVRCRRRWPRGRHAVHRVRPVALFCIGGTLAGLSLKGWVPTSA
jgi:predicted permease